MPFNNALDMKSKDAETLNYSILLIEPGPAIQSHIASCLRDDGFEVNVVADVARGLEFWHQYHPEVIICGAAAPEAEGLALLRDLRASDAGAQVIMVSGSGDTDEVVRALRLGATDFLLDPVPDPEVLSHAVKRALEQHQLEQENQRYRNELEQKNRELQNSLRLLKEDQEAARAVQLKMLPPTARQFEHFSVEYRIIPSLYLSGDFIDYFSLGKGRIGFYLADVSGHGASSAFVTVLLKTMANRVKQRFRSSGNDGLLLPAQVLKKANEELIPLGLGKHLAVFCGYIDCHAKKLIFCSAAHFPPPILVTEGKSIALEGKGLPVGIFDEVSYENHQVSIGESFRLVIFSDGILEVMPQDSVAEKERYLMEIVSSGIHNVETLATHLGLDTKDAVPDDIALMTVSCDG